MIPHKDLKIEHIDDMPLIKREIINYLFNFIERKKPNTWWHYKGSFEYDGKQYDLECDVRCDRDMFTYRNLYISHKQEIINVEDALSMPLLPKAKIYQ